MWLYRRSTDLLFGYGFGYLAALPLLLAAAAAVGDLEPLFWVGAALALVTTTPHYGATLLRVYEERAERQRYALFAVWITLALACLFVFGLHDRWIGSLLLTAYVSWSPWHFGGQNYGLAVMCLRRRGGDLPDRAKRPLHASFVLSSAIAFVAIHAAGSGLLFAQDALDGSQTFAVLPIGIPVAFAAALCAVLGALYLGCLGAFVLRLEPRPRPVELLPVAGLVAVQALWFAVPSLATVLGFGGVRLLLPFTATTISIAHAAQYLWVTGYYARLSSAGPKFRPFFLKCLLAGGAISTPALLFTPGLFAEAVPLSAGVLVLWFSVVNIHHFILDGAIWKLRDGRVARALLRSESEAGPIGPSPRRWLRPLLLALGGVGALVKVWLVVTGATLDPDGDPRAFQATVARLQWLGRASPELWGAVAVKLEAIQEVDGAIEAWRASIDGAPEPPVVNVNRLAWLLIEHRAADPQSVEEATAIGHYLVDELGETRAEGQQTLAAAHFAAGRLGRAVLAAERALEIAQANGDPRRIREVGLQVATYSSALARARARRVPGS